MFVLGPSHHVYLPNCALPSPKCSAYETPLGLLQLDTLTLDQLRKTKVFAEMDKETDEDEHSIEMHLPYIRHIFKEYAIISLKSYQ